jgi:hypothetical protein
MISGSDTRVPSLCPQSFGQAKSTRTSPARSCPQLNIGPRAFVGLHRATGSLRGGAFCINRDQGLQAANRTPPGKAAKTGGIIFSGLLPIRSRKRIETGGWVHNPAYGRAFLNSGRAGIRGVSDFTALPRDQWRKLPCHGPWRTPRSPFAASSVGDCATRRRPRVPRCCVTDGDGQETGKRPGKRRGGVDRRLVDTPDPRCYQLRPLPARPAPQDRSRRMS